VSAARLSAHSIATRRSGMATKPPPFIGWP
jgi:hypothetical protein